MRIGLFGGTFNPIHYGHLRASLEVKETFRLDKIYLIPSAIPPHKSPHGVVDAKDRFHMIQLAISDQSDLVVSDVELDRPGPSYSIDTVHHFQNMLPKDTRFYLILGTDAFYDIDTWKAYKDFFDLVPMIIMLRPGDRFSMDPRYLKNMPILKTDLVLSIRKSSPSLSLILHLLTFHPRTSVI